MNAPENVENPVRHVRHAELERASASRFKSRCPVCGEGVLMFGRDPATLELQALDFCVLCGQQFIYDDIEDVRVRSGDKHLPGVLIIEDER